MRRGQRMPRPRREKCPLLPIHRRRTLCRNKECSRITTVGVASLGCRNSLHAENSASGTGLQDSIYTRRGAAWGRLAKGIKEPYQLELMPSIWTRSGHGVTMLSGRGMLSGHGWQRPIGQSKCLFGPSPQGERRAQP